MRKRKSDTSLNEEYLKTGSVDTLIAAMASQNELAA